MNLSEKVKPLLWTMIIFSGILYMFNSLVINNPAFDIKAYQNEELIRESFVSEREKRNEASMKRSYGEMMAVGQSYLDQDRIKEARKYFFTAKTLYPRAMGPRKNLCYIDMLLCQQDSRYCSYTKREIYFAMQHVSEQDKKTADYLYQLATMVQIDTLLELDESAAMSAIF